MSTPDLGYQESVGIILLMLVSLFTTAFASATAPTIIRLDYWLLSGWFIFSALQLRYAKLRFFARDSDQLVTLDSPFLSRREVLAIALSALVVPSIIGLLVCLMWQKSHYLKARQANLVAMAALVFHFLLQVAISRQF